MIYDSTKAIADPKAATYDALTARFRDTAAVMDVLAGERKTLTDEIKAREAEVAAKLRLGTLTADEKLLYQSVLASPNFKRA